MRVFIETFGCQMNVADSERAASILGKAGYEPCDSAQKADVVVLNTCSVREKAEQKVYQRLNNLDNSKKGATTQQLIVVMGCMSQLEGRTIFEKAPTVNVVAGTGAVERLPELLKRVRAGEESVVDLDISTSNETAVEQQSRHSKNVAFVPIINGCNKFCTYCIVPYSRGREYSRAPLDIINDVVKLKAAGFKEVHLIGQNVNSYRPKTEVGLEGFKGATPFSRLLRAVASTNIPRIKFTTSFPRDFHGDIVETIEENGNLCNWVHLPVQSGNNRILRLMRRGYKVEDYLKHVEVIKNAKRSIALTSDIIIGFPGETYSEFKDTVGLVEKCQFDGLYIFKYSARSGTPAAKLSDTVPSDEKSLRFLELERVQKAIQKEIYAGYTRKELEVLVEGRSAKSYDDLCGHTTCHKVVNFRGGPNLIGTIRRVSITEAKPNSLYGELIGEC